MKSIWVVLLLLSAVPAHATAVIYSTGFEVPDYITGVLAGQDGWYQDIGPTANITVQNTIAKSGSQAAMFNPVGAVAFTRAYRFISTLEPITSMSADIMLGSGAGSQYNFTAADSAFSNFSETVITPAGHVLLQSIDTNVVLTRDVWYNIELLYNFTTKKESLFIDGSFVKQVDINPAGSHLLITAIQILPDVTSTDRLYVDNLTVASAPEPATYGMLALGVIGMFAAGKNSRRRSALKQSKLS